MPNQQAVNSHGLKGRILGAPHKIEEELSHVMSRVDQSSDVIFPQIKRNRKGVSAFTVQASLDRPNDNPWGVKIGFRECKRAHFLS